MISFKATISLRERGGIAEEMVGWAKEQ
jgi:hypothetical protein